jgi:hypothetical protein
MLSQESVKLIQEFCRESSLPDNLVRVILHHQELRDLIFIESEGWYLIVCYRVNIIEQISQRDKPELECEVWMH